MDATAADAGRLMHVLAVAWPAAASRQPPRMHQTPHLLAALVVSLAVPHHLLPPPLLFAHTEHPACLPPFPLHPQVEYSKIREIRSAPRGGGLWGDVVIFLKGGERLPLAGLERHREIVDHIEGFISE